MACAGTAPAAARIPAHRGDSAAGRLRGGPVRGVPRRAGHAGQPRRGDRPPDPVRSGPVSRAAQLAARSRHARPGGPDDPGPGPGGRGHPPMVRGSPGRDRRARRHRAHRVRPEAFRRRLPRPVLPQRPCHQQLRPGRELRRAAGRPAVPPCPWSAPAAGRARGAGAGRGRRRGHGRHRRPRLHRRRSGRRGRHRGRPGLRAHPGPGRRPARGLTPCAALRSARGGRPASTGTARRWRR